MKIVHKCYCGLVLKARPFCRGKFLHRLYVATGSGPFLKYRHSLLTPTLATARQVKKDKVMHLCT